MKNERRRRHFVNSQVQGALIEQGILYWFWGTLWFVIVISFYRIALPIWLGTGAELHDIWYYLSPVVVASVSIFPFVVLRCIRFSHRFVGPIIRLQSTLKRIAEGEEVRPIGFRKIDFWQGLDDDVNRVIARVEALQAERSLTTDVVREGSQEEAISDFTVTSS